MKDEKDLERISPDEDANSAEEQEAINEAEIQVSDIADGAESEVADEVAEETDEVAEDTDGEAKAFDKTAVTEDNFAKALDKSAGFSGDELDDELNQLASMFKDELKKAQSLTEEELIKSGILIQQYEDDEGIIAQEELCQCCGERRRDKSRGENYEYCAYCREAMKKYPIGKEAIIVLLAVLFVGLLSVSSFMSDFTVYKNVKKADDYYSQGKLTSALSSYDTAISLLYEEGVVAKRPYFKVAEILFATMPDGLYSMTDISTCLRNALSDFEAKLPMYSAYIDMYTENQLIYQTYQKVYEVMSAEEYAEFDGKDEEMYEEIMTEIGSVISAEITVSSLDGKESQILQAHEPMVRFVQYMFAYATEHYDDSYQYMNLVYELAPQYLWIYAYELGMADLQRGNTERALEFANELYNINVEDSNAFGLYSGAYRLSGDTEGAVKWADEGLKIVSDSTELMRLKAMAQIAQGDYEDAKETVDAALAIEEYDILIMVAMVAENELGNADAVEDYKEYFEEQEVELSEKMENYLAGKITAKAMFTEGTGDVK